MQTTTMQLDCLECLHILLPFPSFLFITYNFPITNSHYSIRSFRNFLVMSYHHKCPSKIIDSISKHLHNFLSCLAIKISSRLISKYNWWSIRKCPSYCNPLLLTTWKLIWKFLNLLLKSHTLNNTINIYWIFFWAIQKNWQHNIVVYTKHRN